MAEEHIVAMKAADDARMRTEMPSTVPTGWEGHVFRHIQFPIGGGMFAIIKPDESYWGPFVVEDFTTDEHSIATAHDHETGEAVVLRVLQQNMIDDPKRWWLKCIDNDGNEIGYIMEWIPDNTLDIQEPDLGQGRVLA